MIDSVVKGICSDTATCRNRQALALGWLQDVPNVAHRKSDLANSRVLQRILRAMVTAFFGSEADARILLTAIRKLPEWLYGKR